MCVYIASRTKNGGIYKYIFDGKKYIEDSFCQMDNPMYMIASTGRMDVLLREPFDNNESGYLRYEINDKGRLINPSEIYSTKGEIACHLFVENENVYCVNYTSGSVIKIPDTLVIHKGEKQSHTHYVGETIDGKYLCVTDLGLDAIYLYNKDLTLKEKIPMPSGHGVRHLCFSEDGYIFSANELKSTVTALKYENETLRVIDTISCTLNDKDGFSAASAIRLYKDKIFVAVRGHDLISCLSFKNDRLNLENSFSCQGKTPRDFCFDDNRLICCNQESDTVTIFEENNNRFELIQTINMKEPICVLAYEKE